VLLEYKKNSMESAAAPAAVEAAALINYFRLSKRCK